MESITTQIGKSGRLVIPAEYRKALGIKEGDTVILSLEPDGGVRISTTRQAVLRAQAQVLEYVSKSTSLSKELIRERHEAAKCE